MHSQFTNYREMPAFIELTERFGFDVCYFHKFRNWGTYSEAEFRKNAVHAPLHPEYHALLQDRLSLQDARSLYSEPFEGEGIALLRYLELAHQLRKVRVPRRAA